jgi:uncharacterized membrane protein YphA (DoxX/SURF4 family)
MSRIAFRFGVIYLSLFCLATQIAGGLFILPGGASLPSLGTLWPMRSITMWVARHVFGVAGPLVYQGNSGDTVFHWTQTAWLLAASIAIALAWSAIDRRGRRDAAIAKWFRLFVRLALAAQMFYYGMAKIIPSQFPPPPLVTLVEPAGNLSLSAMLWTYMGSSTPYQVFTGVAEVAAGLFLLTPQTTPLGALIALADMILVWILNMTYDVGLKQISFHLVVLSLYLLWPDLRRLANVLVFDRPAPASTHPPLFATARANRIALWAQVAFGLYLLAVFTTVARGYYYGPGGGGEPKSPLYGIWNIDELWVDGEVRPASVNDYDRQWRRAIFDAPDMLVFQRLDDSFAHYGVTVDTARQTLMLRKGQSRVWRALFAYRRERDDRLVIDGEMDGHTIHAVLLRVPFDTFRLLNSTFRWVRPPDPTAG